jgi:dTDP-glucose pyrophosphorylase
MAPVSGKPFLCYLMDRLVEADVERIVLATGYKHEVIESYFGHSYRGVEVIYSREDTPLFTGGAIVQAARLLRTDNFVVLNEQILHYLRRLRGKNAKDGVFRLVVFALTETFQLLGGHQSVKCNDEGWLLF